MPPHRSVIRGILSGFEGGGIIRRDEVHDRLGLAKDQPVSLQAILGMSVERLSASDQERFALLSAFGADPLNWKCAEAAHIWECSLEDAEATTARLIQHGLVNRGESQRGDYYWMHALLADYAEEMAEKMEL